MGIPWVVEEAVLFLSGRACRASLYYVYGCAKLCQIAADGQQVNLRTLVPSQLFGAVGAVDVTALYPACAKMLEDSEAFAIRSAEFRRFLEGHPHLSFGSMKLMTGYIQEMQNRYREMVTEKVERRIGRCSFTVGGSVGQTCG